MIDRDPIGEALVDPQTYANRETYHALLTKLRREDPLYWATPEGYRPFWVVTKHADIQEVERQPAQFLSGPRLEIFSAEQERKVREATGRDAAVGKTVLHMDGAEHRAYRGLSQGWFMPNSLKHMDQPLADLARRYVDKMSAAGGHADFVTLVSELFPLEVILMILGLPSDEAPKLLRLTRDFVGRETAPVPPGLTREDLIIRASQAIFDYFGSVVDARLMQPSEDVASLIAQRQGKEASRSAAPRRFPICCCLASPATDHHQRNNGGRTAGLHPQSPTTGPPQGRARPHANRDRRDPTLGVAGQQFHAHVGRGVHAPRQDREGLGLAVDRVCLGQSRRGGVCRSLCLPRRSKAQSPDIVRLWRAPMPGSASGQDGTERVLQGADPAPRQVELAGEAEMLPAVTSNQLVTLPIRYRMTVKVRVLEPA